MILTCKHCGFVVKSYDVMAEKAWAEVYGLLMIHVGEKHRSLVEVFTKSMQQITMMLASQCSLLEFVVIPEEEGFVTEYMDKMQEKIMEAIGMEPDEEEEEDTIILEEKEEINALN